MTVLAEPAQLVALAHDGNLGGSITRVVSWNDAAEMNSPVDSDALVIPSSTLVYSSGNLPSGLQRCWC